MSFMIRRTNQYERFINIRLIHNHGSQNSYLSAKKARQMFLDFYIRSNNYKFVKSSPVVPLHDATVPFVNAGMNQFKGIFLNTCSPPYNKVANSQKCIRVGGKHNDLDAVGHDGYHHTFFEMLGNWTFKQCSKAEQCSLAWKLLTDIYKINKNQLYVTYFGGNKIFSIPPDLECRDIWRQIGLPSDRILPFDMQENFWEMGTTGPCGPCTEIHYDHRNGPDRSRFVNKGLHELIELWNIVFIEYKREQNGSIVPLPEKHVDTGMGFERLVGVLQHKISNYDTDVFQYLFKAILKNCQGIPKYQSVFGEQDWNSLNANYRIIADHVRMITVSLGDGMIPEQNQKLRRVLRKAFYVSETVFRKQNGFIKELSNYVIDNLGSVYSELEKNSKQIQQIIDYEEVVYKELRQNVKVEWSKITSQVPELLQLDVLETPGLVQAYKDVRAGNIRELSPAAAYRLYDTYGLDENAIARLCNCLTIQFNKEDFVKEFDSVKNRSRSSTILNVMNLPDLSPDKIRTEDKFKYKYERSDSGYCFPPLEVQVLKILKNNKLVDLLEGGDTDCALILDKTNLYCEAGGQISDEGIIRFRIGEFHVQDLKKINDCILHIGKWTSRSQLQSSLKGVLTVNEEKRLAKMRNHTAVHLLNAAIKRMKGATCQKSSKVTDSYLNLDVGVFSTKLSHCELEEIEEWFNKIVQEGINVRVIESDFQTVLNEEVTLIPGEIYPDKNIRLIEIKSNSNNLVSREPCCGTHLWNTKDIRDFCFVAAKSLGRSTTSIYAFTGERAVNAREIGRRLLEEATVIQDLATTNTDNNLEHKITALRKQLSTNIMDDNAVPLLVRFKCVKVLDSVTQMLKEQERNKWREFIDLEMKSAVETKILTSDLNNKYIVHYLHTSLFADGANLQRATNAVSEMPVMIISCADNIVKARCTVPEDYLSDQFTAEKWMHVVSEVFQSSLQFPKGQNKNFVCNLKGKKINETEWQPLLHKSLEAAEQFAKKHL